MIPFGALASFPAARRALLETMFPTLRWFGPEDPVTLDDVRHAGAHGVVTALHSVPNGRVWSRAAIDRLLAEIQSAGVCESGEALTWSVVESVPIDETIKQGTIGCDQATEAFAKTLTSLGQAGVRTVCYNFMPVLDWTRTDLAWQLPSGGLALRFSQPMFDAFDLFELKRPGAEDRCDEERIELAKQLYEALSPEQRAELREAVIAGLPGSEESYSLDQLRSQIEAYEDVDEAALRANLIRFLEAIVPVAEVANVQLALHPDDPPWPLLGLPRIASTQEHLRMIFSAVPSPANGLTFCRGSLAARLDNDLKSIVEEFSERIGFVHLRNVQHEPDGSFHETQHLNGSVSMPPLLKALARESRRREAPIPFRPDHGIASRIDQLNGSKPGYPYVGRLRGLAELRGLLVGLDYD